MDTLPREEAAARVRRLQERMQGSSVDAVLVFQNADLYYFAGTVQAGLLAIPPSGEPVFLVQKSLARARLESPWERLLPLGSLKEVPALLEGEGFRALRRIGLELDVLPASYYFRLQSAFPAVQFVDASEHIRRIRMVKSAYEIGFMRTAAEQLDSAFAVIPKWMKPGVTELQIASELERFLRARGHQGRTRMRMFNGELGFGIVAGGASATYPTCFPGPVGFEGLYPAVPSGAGLHRIRESEPVMVDIVGGFGGYIADKTRVFAVGELPREMVDAHRFVLCLMRDVESMLKPGTRCSDLHGFIAGRVRDSPWDACFMGVDDERVGFVGHGVGLELDEWPVLSARSEERLETGMTVAIEPKIFFPDRGGVGVENTYLITPTGWEKLGEFPEDIVPAGA